jgi:hypothetical protein
VGARQIPKAFAEGQRFQVDERPPQALAEGIWKSKVRDERMARRKAGGQRLFAREDAVGYETSQRAGRKG